MLVQVRLLDGFRVVAGGKAVTAQAWSRRDASALVKLLALAPQARLHRERVIDALWPEVTLDIGLPRLYKAAHYARRACEDQSAVTLRDEVVALFPDAEIQVDAVTFEQAAAALTAKAAAPAEAYDEVLASAGELLPDDLGEPWLDEPRQRIRLRVVELLRGARRWEDLLALEPGDEQAHVELLRESVLRGDRGEGLRRYARMEEALASELGISPPPEAVVLRERLLAGRPALPLPTAERMVAPVSRWSTGAALLERESELDQMATDVEAAVECGHGVIILVSGEAGAGKSTVVRALLDRLRSDVRVYWGGCDDLLAPRSLGPFRDMAEEHPDLSGAFSVDRLEDVLPALLRAFAARPSVVVVEDAHWADDATLDAIRFLARRVPAIAGALVLTLRDSGADAEQPLRRLLGRLVGPQVRRVTLSPLSLDAIRRLGARNDTEAAEIHRVTQGNPFFVTEVLAAGGSGVPATVRDAVLARLSVLRQPVQNFLERLAVVPTRTERWLAETLADGDPAIVLAAERSGVLQGTETWVAFRHELARQVVETSLTAGERVLANRLVVDALLRRPDLEPARLVHHAERSGQVQVILEHGPTAAYEAARLGAHRQAAGVLHVVLEHRDLLSPRDVADLVSRRAYSLSLLNQYQDALECAEAGVMAAERAEDDVLLADALLVLARVVLFAEGPMRCRAAAVRAVDILEASGDEARLAAALTEAARAHSNLATASIVADADERAERYAERALLMARRVRRVDIEAQAMCYLGDARLSRGDPRGQSDLARAISLASADSRAETKVRCMVNAAHGAYRDGRLDDAERFVAAGLQASADHEFFTVRYRLRLTLAAVHASRGDWDRASSELQHMIDEPGDPGIMASLARSLLARLLARQGDHARAGEVLAVAAERVAGVEDTYVSGPVAVAQVELGWLDGSLGSMTDAARRVLQVAARTGHASIQAELSCYLRRAGVDVPDPVRAPGPWAPTIAGDWDAAAAGWAALGERYEEAVVLATAPDLRARERGVQILGELGAAGTLLAV